MDKIKILLSYGGHAENYIEALNNLGAEAVAKRLPNVDTNYDGLILCGGADINPERYGEEMNGAVDIDLERDAAEFALLKAYLDAGKPVLGVCRGHQLINVFFGGTLYQDMVEADFHKRHNENDSVHEVSAISDSIVGRLYGDSFSVNSSHHQAIKALGTGLRATAYWNSQYIEAVEHSDYPVFSIQWHPERMCFSNKRDDTVCGADIFSHFIDMCRENRDKTKETSSGI